MGEFFKSIKFKIILCIIGFLFGIMLYSISKSGYSTKISSTISSAFNPIRKVTENISTSITKKIDIFKNHEKYYEENETLKKEISKLHKDLVDYEKSKKELSELKKFINIKEENESFELSPPCNIIGRIANDPYKSFILDRGKKDGINLYDPVVTSQGLVGIIIELADDYSTVRTILSPEISIGALSVPSDFTGIIEGDSKYTSDGLCKMKYIDKNNNIEIGDTIITSGNSGRFPEAYLVGKVKEIGISETALSSYVIIEPFVDIDKLTSVIVITDFSGKNLSYEN
jgi:rod shape-determining protein MreC